LVDAIAERLAAVSVKDIWGVGPRYARKLNAMGVHTAADLVMKEDDWIKKHMTICGLRTVMELRGTPCLSLETVRADKKGIGCSRSFGKMVTSLSQLKEAISTFTARAAEKLRAQNDVAGVIHIYIMTNAFRKDLPQYGNSLTTRLSTPTAYTPELSSAALKLLECIYKDGYHYKKAGVYLTDITPKTAVQTNLFEADYPFARNHALMAAMDSINHRWGRGTAAFLGSGIKKPWSMRRSRLSRRFTTCWNELLEASLE
jgi:DNA polymerase V